MCQSFVNPIHSFILFRFALFCFNRWNKEFIHDLRQSRIETTKTLARKIADAAKPPKVFISSSAVGKLK